MKTFIIEQKIKLIANHYRVYAANDQGEKGVLVAYAKQKPIAFREKVIFYTDEDCVQVAFSLEARQVMDFRARYDVRDAGDELIGTLGKVFGASLWRSTWHVYRPGEEEQPQAIARERSPTVAILRRLWELIGEIPFFIKYHFDFIDPASAEVVASYEKITTFRDHYRLRIEDQLLDKIAWQPVVAMGILLDALQSR